jgi:hypothetical protein
MVFWTLLVSGHVNMCKVDGYCGSSRLAMLARRVFCKPALDYVAILNLQQKAPLRLCRWFNTFIESPLSPRFHVRFAVTGQIWCYWTLMAIPVASAD